MTEYAHPEVLGHHRVAGQSPHRPAGAGARSRYDPSASYELGHIPGATLVDWKRDINDPVRRDILSKGAVRAAPLEDRSDPGHDTRPVRRLPQLVRGVRLLDLPHLRPRGHQAAERRPVGKWIDEGREVTEETPSFTATSYKAPDADTSIRSFRGDVEKALGVEGRALVDVRSPAEFKGEISAPPEYSNEARSAADTSPAPPTFPGHRPSRTTTRSSRPMPLRELYAAQGVTADKSVITYCRIGERSSHTWFVLSYLLGFPAVSNYDGSWSEWGNSVRSADREGSPRSVAV